MSIKRIVTSRSIGLLTGFVLAATLSGCKETAEKVNAPKAATKSSGISSPQIPESEFPTAAKDRMALKEIPADLWNLQSFSSVTQAISGEDQLYIATSFFSPTDGKFLSECNATGKFATILLKNPAILRMTAQIPTRIDLSSKDPFSPIYILRYGAAVDLATQGCSPSFQWHSATDQQVVKDFLSGLENNNLVEKLSENTAAKLQAAFTQSKDELVLHYKTEAADTITTIKFVYTREAKPILPAVIEDKEPTKVTQPEEEETPKTPDFPYGIHD